MEKSIAGKGNRKCNLSCCQNIRDVSVTRNRVSMGGSEGGEVMGASQVTCNLEGHYQENDEDK